MNEAEKSNERQAAYSTILECPNNKQNRFML